jgi:carbon-monoxide dehydrogenase large subunit
MECLLTCSPREIGLGAAELRARNLVRPEDMPYRVGTSLFGSDLVYENADFPRALATAVEAAGLYRGGRGRRGGDRIALASAAGRDRRSGQFRTARICVDPDGTVAVASGISLRPRPVHDLCPGLRRGAGSTFDSVSVQLGDTDLVPFGRGAFAARGAPMGANAVLGAAQRPRKLPITPRCFCNVVPPSSTSRKGS